MFDHIHQEQVRLFQQQQQRDLEAHRNLNGSSGSEQHPPSRETHGFKDFDDIVEKMKNFKLED